MESPLKISTNFAPAGCTHRAPKYLFSVGSEIPRQYREKPEIPRQTWKETSAHGENEPTPSTVYTGRRIQPVYLHAPSLLLVCGVVIYIQHSPVRHTFLFPREAKGFSHAHAK